MRTNIVPHGHENNVTVSRLFSSSKQGMAVAQIAIKQEVFSGDDEEATGVATADPVNLEERILQLCAEHPKGITDEMIVADQPAIDTVKRMKALQRLLSMVCNAQ